MELEISGDETPFQRFTRVDPYHGVSCFIIDIPETIPQLGYGTHQFFRYYGKFPSILGREMIQKFSRTGDSVLDCFSGSGTTLVEAQIAGRRSYGIDINPLAVFASNLKTRQFDRVLLSNAFDRVLHLAQSGSSPAALDDVDSRILEKWFAPAAQRELSQLRSAILNLNPGDIQDLLTLTFLSIIRRTSRAFDGEVRPHINRGKKARSPFDAFRLKYLDMVAGLNELDSVRRQMSSSLSVIGDNRDQRSYGHIPPGSVPLVVAHPPYLNSFNYLQVFSLEFAWSRTFSSVWNGWTDKEIRKLEQKAWPATSEKIRTEYYRNFLASIEACLPSMTDDGTLAVVVGDATIRGVLEPVHRTMMVQLESLGFKPVEVWFRTTHYGIGKYAYRDRADYHGDAEKKDAIMFFRRTV